jgi:UDP-GlcNAc:undecaprenyl-phosphate GlcNAc-1-phosphate transferase
MINGISLIDGALTFFLSFFLIQLVKKYADRFNLVDIPNERSSHTKAMPRGGGIAIYLSFMIVIVFFHFDLFLQYIWFFISTLLVFMLGLYDDRYGSSARLKFLVVIVASLMISVFDGLMVDTLGFWFGHELKLPYFIALFFTAFAISGFTNALNLIDGLDGLSGSISIVILASLYYIGSIYNDQFIVYISLYTIFAILAFLVFNWYPASIFMGDSGSLVLGFIISALSIKAIDYVSDSAILFIAAVPIIDTITVMTRRIQRNQSPFTPDKTHFHHKVFNLKKSVDASVHILVSIQIVLSTIGILLRDKSDIVNLTLFFIILFLFFQALDDRRVVRDLLFISKIKKGFVEFYYKITNCSPIRWSGVALIVIFIIKIFFS